MVLHRLFIQFLLQIVWEIGGNTILNKNNYFGFVIYHFLLGCFPFGAGF